MENIGWMLTDAAGDSLSVGVFGGLQGQIPDYMIIRMGGGR